uniref:Uncharacterized protein n=1 Tax=Cacopsylla melanoneura TaxID=428564 RepID=A0A8D8Z4I9_9HEMI
MFLLLLLLTTPYFLETLIVVYHGLPQFVYQDKLNAGGGRFMPRLHVPYCPDRALVDTILQVRGLLVILTMILILLFSMKYSLAKALVMTMTVYCVLYCCPVQVDPCCLKVFNWVVCYPLYNTILEVLAGPHMSWEFLIE